MARLNHLPTWRDGAHWAREFFLIPFLYSAFSLVFLRTGYHTFHFFAELGSILVGLMALATASVSFRFLHNNFLIIISLGLGWCAILDIVHVAAYEGMNLFTVDNANLASQVWVISRFLQAMSFLLAIVLASKILHPLRINAVMALYCLLAGGLLFSGMFPDTFLPDTGLTLFKIVSEYVIILIFIIAGIFLTLKRALFQSRAYLEIMLAIFAMLLAELCFTAYLSVFDAFNAAGHILKIFSYWFVFRALILASVQAPFRDRERLILDLRERVKELRTLHEISEDTEIPGLTQRELLEKTIEHLPRAFLHPELALAAVNSRWGNFGNPRRIADDRKIEMELQVGEEVVATILVGYPESIDIQDPVFLKEEYTLMNIVGTRLEDVLTRIANQQQIDRLSNLYATLSATNRAIVQSRNETQLFDSLLAVLKAAQSFSQVFIADLKSAGENAAVHIHHVDGMDETLVTKMRGLLHQLITGGEWKRDGISHSPIMLPSKLEELGLARGLALKQGSNRPVLMPLVVQGAVAHVVGIFVEDELELAGETWLLLQEMQSDLEYALNTFGEVKKRHRAENIAYDSEQRFQAVFERSPVPLILMGLKDNEPDLGNQAFYDWLGVPRSEQMNPMEFLENYMLEQDKIKGIKEYFLTQIENVQTKEGAIDLPEIKVRHSSGAVLHVSASMINVGNEILLALHDLTAIRNSEQKLRENEERFRSMVEQIGLPISVSRDGVLLYTNPYLNNLLGKSAEDVAGLRLREIYQPLPDSDGGSPGWGPSPNEPARQHDVLIKTGTGEELVLNVQVSNIPWQDGRAYISVGEDVTERRKIEKALQHSHELLNELSRQVPGVIYQFQLFPDGRSCFPFASERMWDIYEVTPEEVREDAAKVFSRLHPEDLSNVEATIAESASRLSVWRSDYRVVLPKQGVRWRTGYARPQKMPDGSILWHGFIEDSTERMNYQQELDRYNQELELSMKGTLEVLSRVVDLRDPYTAGHERRVALIAAAIGREIGMTAKEVENLQLAGMVHDIGKIAVPAEILSKPTKLSASEFELIKGHAQAGYDILKEVPLPGVIGTAIWQHHERLDGSGYPRGLKGDEIIREARILAVADVLESMGSHRPYRPALGMEKALQELHSKAGSLYDEQIVEVVTHLVKDKGLDVNSL